MDCLFTADCKLAALARTRKVLDRYLPRIGETSWAGPLTQQGVQDIERQLKAGASKNTSVACFNTRDMTEPLFVVGRNTRRVNGAHHVATVKRKPTISPVARHVALMARLGGYIHDWGKATQGFQAKLRGNTPEQDAVRHEFISAWFVEQFIGAASPVSVEAMWLAWEEKGLAAVPTWEPLMLQHGIQSAKDALLYIVLTHHRVFSDKTDPHEAPNSTDSLRKQPKAWLAAHAQRDAAFARDKYKRDPRWAADAKRFAQLWARIEKLWRRLAKADTPERKDPALYWQTVAIRARACLILADHEISGHPLEGLPGVIPTGNLEKHLAANTDHQAGGLKQALIDHLWSVGDQAHYWAQVLANPGFLGVRATTVAHLLGAESGVFGWQTAATDYLQHQEGQGHLIFNVAGTGAGKTRANLKCLAALSPQHLRVSAAFNLLTLTQQTKRQYVDMVEKVTAGGGADIACVIGNPLAIKLSETALRCDYDPTPADVITSDPELGYDSTAEWVIHLPQKGRESTKKMRAFLGAPVLTSTLDQIIAAGNTGEQGRHALAILRVAHSDLIIDEADSLDISGFVAMLRLIKLSASFGRNIVISSATLPPKMASAIFEVWMAGTKCYQAAEGKTPGGVHIVGDSAALPASLEIGPTTTQAELEQRYEAKVAAHAAEALQTPTKRATTKELPAASTADLQQVESKWIPSIMDLHRQNNEKAGGAQGDLSISIGLVRVSRVDLCLQITRALAQSLPPPDTQILVTPYHARELLVRRSWKEQQLDTLLQRKPGSKPWFDRTGLLDVDQAVASAKQAGLKNLVFIVIATPVEEVGRDHDFDWAIIDPSSMSSIIQTAGRVNRHRKKPVPDGAYNVLVIDKALRPNDEKPYARPGFQCETPPDKGGATHRSTNPRGRSVTLGAKALLPAASTFRLTAAMVLGGEVRAGAEEDTGQTRFAKEDAKGITHQLQKPLSVLGRDLLERPESLTAWCALNYRLRDIKKQPVYAYEPGSNRFGQVVYAIEDVYQRSPKVRDDGSAPPKEEEQGNYWLCPSVTAPQLAATIESAKLTASQRLLAYSASFPGKGSWHLTLLGIERAP